MTDNSDLKIKDDRIKIDQPELDNLCNRALSQWGFDPQMDMAIEEMSELIKAILKYRRDPAIQRAMHIAEEMVDVKIMMRQIEIAMQNTHPDFNTWQKNEMYIKSVRLDNMLERSKF